MENITKIMMDVMNNKSEKYFTMKAEAAKKILINLWSENQKGNNMFVVMDIDLLEGFVNAANKKGVCFTDSPTNAFFKLLRKGTIKVITQKNEHELDVKSLE